MKNYGKSHLPSYFRNDQITSRAKNNRGYEGTTNTMKNPTSMSFHSENRVKPQMIINKVPNKRKKQEESMQIAVCKFLKLQYPEVIFMSDGLSGMKLTIGQAVKAKKMRSGRAIPDIFIAQACKGCHGLFLELKREGETVWLKDGSLSKDQHIQEQNDMLRSLRLRGYAAHFAVGLDNAMKLINEYLNT